MRDIHGEEDPGRAYPACQEAHQGAPLPRLELEKELIPLVKKGDAAQKAGDLDGALALYQEVMDGFRGAGYKRPKLQEKIDAVEEKIAAQDAEEETAAARAAEEEAAAKLKAAEDAAAARAAERKQRRS